MKKLALTVISASLCALPMFSNAFTKANIETILVETCKDIKTNKVVNFKFKLKENHLSLPLISDKLMCNGESVYQFALTHKADKMANLLRTGSVSIRDVAMNSDDKIWVWLD